MSKQKTKKNISLRDISRRYKPREKASWQGIRALRNYELLALIIGSGSTNSNVLELSKKVERLLLLEKNELDKKKLQKISGVGEANAFRILASLELGKRLSIGDSAALIDSPEKIYLLAKDLQNKKQEHCLAFYLNGRQELLCKKTVSIGGLNFNYLEPREIFADAILLGASSLILVHNHPSGNSQPSDDDLLLTEKMAKVADLLGIKLLDHLIIGQNKYFSIKENFSQLLIV